MVGSVLKKCCFCESAKMDLSGVNVSELKTETLPIGVSAVSVIGVSEEMFSIERFTLSPLFLKRKEVDISPDSDPNSGLHKSSLPKLG